MALRRANLRSGVENTISGPAPGKSLAEPSLGGKTTRSALGDISNRSQAIAQQGKAGAKKSAAQVETRRSTRTRGAKDGDVVPTATTASTTAEAVLTSSGAVREHVDCAADQVAVAFSQMMHIEDVDAGDADNPQLCSEYVQEIYHYMRRLESKYALQRNYFNGQRDVTIEMRAILVDWLIQVHGRFQLLQETLYVAVAILDRFLSLNMPPRNQLQLVGVTAMLLASKYEEIYAPEIEDFVFITDNTYTATQIRGMEVKILATLQFELGKPFCLQFLRRNSKAGHADALMHVIAKYLMELTLPDGDMVCEMPSTIAASALNLTFKLLNKGAWTPTLEYYSGYTESQLTKCTSHMAQILRRASAERKLLAVRTKYSNTRLQSVATLPELQPAHIDRIFPSA